MHEQNMIQFTPIGMNVREGMGYDNLSILGEVIDIDNAIEIGRAHV